MRGGILTLARVRGTTTLTRTGRRGYHGLRLADCRLGSVAPPASGLTRTDSGLLYYSDFTGADGNMSGFDSWSAVQGTWEIASNQAKATSNGSFDRIVRATPTATAMVIETRCQLPAGYIGHCIMNLDNTNYWQSIVAVTDRQYKAIAAGSDVGGINAAGGSGLVVNTWHIWKSSFRAGKLLGQWLDKVVKAGPTFDASAVGGNTAASGFGLLHYQAQNCLYDYVAVYRSTIISVTGLSGTMAWRLRTAGDVTVAESAAQSAGEAAKEIGDLIDCPASLYMELHTSTAWSSLLARYPASGVATDVYGGSQFLYTP